MKHSLNPDIFSPDKPWVENPHKLSSILPPLLTYHGSTTQYMQQHGQHMKVEQVQQQISQCLGDEPWMGVTNFEAFVREVLLSVDGQPWMQALSIFPAPYPEFIATLRQHPYKPLGNTVPDIAQRSPLQYHYDQQTQQFARRSRISGQGYAWFLYEQFL